jgi:hypothetical protein
MFGTNNNWSNKLLHKITSYIDTRFEDYRSQIADDLAKGLAVLAGLVALWTVAIISVVFAAFTFALLIGFLLSFWLGTLAYILSFLTCSLILFAGSYWLLKNKRTYIEMPIEKLLSKVLDAQPKMPSTPVIYQEPEPQSSPIVDMDEEED